MTSIELQLLADLLEKFEESYYPVDDGSSELQDLHSVIGDVEYYLMEEGS
jgi:hypothetical protein